MSERGIPTTHTGSLPRPAELLDLLEARDRGEPVDESRLSKTVAATVGDLVSRQREIGLDVVGDGEAGKTSYFAYVSERVSGFSPVPHDSRAGGMAAAADLRDFPEYARRYLSNEGAGGDAGKRFACTESLAYSNRTPLEADLKNLATAVESADATAAFVSAASPGIISQTLSNQYYSSPVAYLEAVADVMKVEYEAIHRAGFVLQIDCPDLALGHHTRFPDKSIRKFREIIDTHVEALNRATANIPSEAMRMHVCWGNYAGPHHRDIPLADIVDIVLRARPAGLVLESCNPRHSHEWVVFEETSLPPGKVLIPGVIESSSPYIEHPEVVAQRLERFASVVGRENLMAGTDCGFATVAGFTPVHPDLVWAKLASLVEGARIASERLW